MFFNGSIYGTGRTVCILFSGTALMAAGTMAGAQTSEGARNQGDYIEEVMVTARKREERLQDLAGSGAALNEALLRDIGGVNNLRDVLDQIVGVTITETNSGDLAEPSIRGAGQSRNRASVSAAGIYRNGAYFASTSLGGRSFERFDTFDVERVEVLRGPQGALYGRNSLGGAINMISNKPEQELYYEITGRAGENDMFGGEFIVNVPLTEQFAARVSYAIEDQDDGFYKDIDGNPVDREDYEHFRFSVRGQPSDILDVTYSYDYMDETKPIGILIRRSGSVLNLTGGDPFQTTINSEHETQHEVQNHNLLIDYDLPGGTISSVTNFRDRDLRRLQDSDQNGPSAAAATRNLLGQTDVDAEILFQELRFVSDVIGPFSYLVGADYYGVDTVEDIDNFARGGQVTPNSSTRIVDIEQDSWAAFAAVDYAFENLPLTVSGEIRYARDNVKGTVRGFLPLQSSEPFTAIDGDEDFSNTPWSVSASWRFEDAAVPGMVDSMMYVKVAAAYRHGGLNLNEGLPTDTFPTKPIYGEETSTTYEIGFKSSWLDRRVTFNAAAYLQDFDDFLDTTSNGCPELCTYFDPVTFEPLGFDANGDPILVTTDGTEGLQSPVAFFIDNVGEVENWGVELELAWRTRIEATGGVFSGNVGWARQLGEVKSVRDDVSPQIAGLEGVRLNRLRERQIKGNLIYRQPLAGFGSMGLTGVEFLISTTYVHEHGGNRNLTETPWGLDGVDRLDARIGLDAERWSLTLNGRNLLDKEYEVFGAPVQFRINDPRYIFGEFTWRMR